MVAHCGFDVHFPNVNHVAHLFMCLLMIHISFYSNALLIGKIGLSYC